MSDATIVVESAAKGGSLITADLAQGYHRDCFAFPGRYTDTQSQGCNQLIRDDKAALIQSAGDFVKMMCWDNSAQAKKPENVQRLLFSDLTDEEEKVVASLSDNGNMQINELVVVADIPIHRMNAILFELEMKGVIRALAGNVYQLIR
jgi:DNA processing protein